MIRNEFEDRTWQAFWRVTVECQPSDMVAESLEMTPAAVRQAKSRVLRRLREELTNFLNKRDALWSELAMAKSFTATSYDNCTPFGHSGDQRGSEKSCHTENVSYG